MEKEEEEVAAGGSVAGSTAGWWPSDRDRFPPRFLLPPSLQTHNCIISTRLPPFSVPTPTSFALAPSQTLSWLFVRVTRRVETSSLPSCYRSLAIAPFSSCFSSSSSFSSASSFARKRCHTRETPLPSSFSRSSFFFF